MKQIAKLLPGNRGLWLPPFSASAANLLDDMTPFVGIDYQQRWMNGHSDWNKLFFLQRSQWFSLCRGRWIVSLLN